MSWLKKRLDDAKGKCVEELSHVLWRYQTTPYRSTGETPFSMTYKAETMIPLKTGFPTLRTSSFGEEFRFNWRAKRKCYGSISVLSTQAQVGVRLQCKVKATSAWRLGVEKNFG